VAQLRAYELPDLGSRHDSSDEDLGPLQTEPPRVSNCRRKCQQLAAYSVSPLYDNPYKVTAMENHVSKGASRDFCDLSRADIWKITLCEKLREDGHTSLALEF